MMYQALDTIGYIPFALGWKLNETLTFKDASCGDITVGASLNSGVNYDDQISIGCQNPSSCVFEADQTYSVGKAVQQGQPLVVTLLKGKNCLNPDGTKMTDTTCINQTEQTGWHLRATATSVTVTNKP